MKCSSIFRMAVIAISSIGLYCSCILEQFPELPPETQEGSDTFGCLVNNELVYALWEYSRYNSLTDQLTISAKCQFNQQFIFLINHPYNRQDTEIDTVRYLLPPAEKWIEAIQTGSFHITRMDDRNSGSDIVSGNFSFDIYTEKGLVHVTMGRFDLHFNTY